ncbi:IPT/TIG domain-containing protein [Pseudomonas sp. CGJS7]|uniref:IPT/TIG domain-containing protein n=1 Tax=Pseudomonas sp. CGJS7 TaxID=3109348 RepID=UPI00300BF914
MTSPLLRVNPGDIISATAWNGIVDSLNEALLRIQALESSAPGTGLAITQLVPAGPYRIGDTLQIIGQNFQFAAGAARVFLNATQVLNLLPGSNDSQLRFVIPNIPGVLEAGTTVDLTVFNQSQSVTRQVILRPQQNPLQGNIGIEWLSVAPTTVVAGQPVSFTYRITSGTNNLATWALNAVVDAANAAAWNAQLRLLDGQGNELSGKQITLAPGQQATVQVQIPSVPAVVNGTTFGMTLSANAATITGTSGIRQFVVGTPTPPPDQSIHLEVDAAASLGALNGTTLTVPGGQNRRLVFTATFTVAGVYTITRSVLGAATGWSVNLDDGTIDTIQINPGDLISGSTARPLSYRVAATASATVNAQVQIKLQRQGNTAAYTTVYNTVRA